MAAEEIAPGTFSLESDPTESTLGEHGWSTVIGGRPFELEPLDLAFRAKIGRVVTRDPSSRSMGARMMRALALAINAIDGESIDGKTIADRQAIVGTLRLQDIVQIAYLRLADEDDGRYDLFHDVETCPHCEAKLAPEVEVDLYSMAVRAHRDVPRAVYRMARPWRVRGTDVETVTFEPPRAAAAIEPMTDEIWTSPVERQILWVASSIAEINGAPTTLSVHDLQSRETPGRHGRKAGLSKVDWQGLATTFGVVSFGDVDMSVMWPHDCGGTIPVSIDWGTSFFGHSGA